MSTIQDEAGNKWHSEDKRKERLHCGVEGSHVCIPFQCEVCWMRNLEGRDITERDGVYTMCIRRANLDAMAGKSHHTIATHRRESAGIVDNTIRANKIIPSIKHRGPFKLDDPVGMSLAVDVLLKSLTAKGMNEEHVQVNTLCHMRATYAKNWDSSPLGVAENASFARGDGRVRPTGCPSQSEFLCDYWRALEYRMGAKPKPNHAVPIGAIVKMLDFIKRDAEAALTVAEANKLLKIGAFICIITGASLHENEGFFVDLHGIRKHLDEGRDEEIPGKLTRNTILSEEACRKLPHVAIALLGKFKGETAMDHHMINIASETMSGLQKRWWIEKLVHVCESEGRSSGLAFATPEGNLAVSMDYDAVFRQYLQEVQAHTDLIDHDHDIDDMYGISRMPKRTAVTCATRAGFKGKDLDVMNWWRTIENVKGWRARIAVNMLYAEAVLLMPTTWRVLYAL